MLYSLMEKVNHNTVYTKKNNKLSIKNKLNSILKNLNWFTEYLSYLKYKKKYNWEKLNFQEKEIEILWYLIKSNLGFIKVET